MKRSTIRRMITLIVFAGTTLFVFGHCQQGGGSAAGNKKDTIPSKDSNIVAAPSMVLDTALFEAKLMHITNGDTSGRWPVRTAYPRGGAILPFKRVLAFYGNLYSKGMGILGELPEDQMLKKLMGEVKQWQAADTTMEVIPALHYIAVTAQGAPGPTGKYRARMPFKEIDKIIAMAQKINALVFLDIQVGMGTVEEEVPQFDKYFKMPNVHFGIDPEFSMKPSGKVPGHVIGTFDAADINFVAGYLAKIVKENNLPPKILVVHRFTRPMVTNYKNIKLRPEVQIVMDMDGWGGPYLKHDSYKSYIWKEPVQFTGFKLFYKNDIKGPKGHLLTPQEVLALKPQPVYIQYQ